MSSSYLTMPSKDFSAHLREAGVPEQYLYLSQIQPGDFDGSVSFTFHTPLFDESIKLVGIVSGTWDWYSRLSELADTLPRYTRLP